MDETQLSLSGDLAAGLREVSCTWRVRFLWSDAQIGIQHPTPTRYRGGSVLRCHSCQNEWHSRMPADATGSACEATETPMLETANISAHRWRRQRTITGRYPISRTTFWRLQSCRQPAVDDEVGASDISCPVAG